MAIKAIDYDVLARTLRSKVEVIAEREGIPESELNFMGIEGAVLSLEEMNEGTERQRDCPLNVGIHVIFDPVHPEKVEKIYASWGHSNIDGTSKGYQIYGSK